MSRGSNGSVDSNGLGGPREPWPSRWFRLARIDELKARERRELEGWTRIPTVATPDGPADCIAHDVRRTLWVLGKSFKPRVATPPSLRIALRFATERGDAVGATLESAQTTCTPREAAAIARRLLLATETHGAAPTLEARHRAGPRPVAHRFDPLAKVAKERGIHRYGIAPVSLAGDARPIGWAVVEEAVRRRKSVARVRRIFASREAAVRAVRALVALRDEGRSTFVRPDRVPRHRFEPSLRPVPAHRHVNPDGTLGGWVAETARVDSTAFLDEDSCVFDRAQVLDRASVRGTSVIAGGARIADDAVVYDSDVRGTSSVRGSAELHECTVSKADVDRGEHIGIPPLREWIEENFEDIYRREAAQGGLSEYSSRPETACVLSEESNDAGESAWVIVTGCGNSWEGIECDLVGIYESEDEAIAVIRRRRRRRCW